MDSDPGFQLFFEASPALQLVLSPELRIVAASDAYLAATMTKREEIEGRHLFDVFPNNPDDPGADGVRNLRASLERVVAGRTRDRMPVQKYDVRRPAEQGGQFEVRYWSPINAPVLNRRGDLVAIVHQVEDVTELVTLRAKDVERDRIAAALRSSNDWFSTTLDSIGDAVIATDVRGAVLFVNRAARELTGWTSEEAGGNHLAEVLKLFDATTGEDVEPPTIKARMSNEPVDLPPNTSLRTKDGRVVPVDDVAAPINDAHGKVIGSVIVLRDVAEQRRLSSENARTLSALRASEEEFRTLADNMPQLAWMARPDGHIFWYNKRWYVYTGTTPELMEGWGWQRVHDPAELPKVLERWKASIASGRNFDMVFPLRGADGAFRPFLTRVNPVKDEAGVVVRWFGTNTDVTERLEADRRKDEFLAMLAHELRNPLASIGNAIQLLRTPGAAAEHAEWSKEIIAKQVKHLARLIDDLLDVSRITRGKIELRKERLDVSPVINSAVDAVRPLLEEKNQELTVSFKPGTLWCEVDPTRLEQVLVNLVTNAARYTPAGGHVRLTARHAGEHLSFKVKDDGVGIPPDQLSSIFDLFAQGDRSIARSEGGLGIGLTIVKRIAELHGGAAVAFSEGPGKGSEFTVTLPATPLPRAAPSPAPAPGPGQGRRSRILVVDDNEDTVRGMSRLLRLLGHEVRAAHDGPEAVKEAFDFRPEFLLLDIGLPGMDGYQVARQLRRAGMNEVVIIAISGYGQAEDRRRSGEAGFNHHLVKPVDYNALVSLIAQPVA